MWVGANDGVHSRRSVPERRRASMSCIPTITKKWKWASMVPPERCTSTADDVTSPMAHMAELNRRWVWPAQASTANLR